MNPGANPIAPPDPEVFSRVHISIGSALWQVQSLEDTLCTFIAIVLNLKPSDAETEIRELVDNLHSKTLGALIAELRKAKYGSAVSTFEAGLNRFLAERNWLVHSSWRQCHSDLYFPDRAERLIHRLQTIGEECSLLREMFGTLVLDWMLASGFSMDEVSTETLAHLAATGVPLRNASSSASSP